MSREVTLNVSLTTPLRDYVHKKVREGGYASASEVVRESLRALKERDKAARSFWTGVREKVAVGQRDMEEGRVEDGEQAMNEIIAELENE